MRETVEQLIVGAVPVLRLQGAFGRPRPREGFCRGREIADRNARELAFARCRCLESVPQAQTRFVYASRSLRARTIGTAVLPVDASHHRHDFVMGKSGAVE